jgi:hypothetical protein
MVGERKEGRREGGREGEREGVKRAHSWRTHPATLTSTRARMREGYRPWGRKRPRKGRRLV